MNGRVYEPAVGRFLSADPFIDDESDSQGWNRYGYVQNRPLRLVDPSGYSSSSIRGFSLGMRIAWINRDSKYGTLNPVVIGTSQELVIQPDGTEEWTMGYTTIWPSWQTELADWFRSGRLERGAGAEPEVDTADERRESQPCASDGTVTGFLEQNGAEVVDRTLSVVGGAGQLVLGATICSGAATCAGGAVLAAHGASNIYEGVTGASSLLRDGYHAVLGSAGDVAYSLVNIGTSVYGLTRPVVSPDTWSLFRNISSDYVPAFRTMTGTELVTEGAGIINDGFRAAGVPLHTCNGP
jgi:Protein of unknown function (DUF4225)